MTEETVQPERKAKLTRRDFLKLGIAGTAIAGLAYAASKLAKKSPVSEMGLPGEGMVRDGKISHNGQWVDLPEIDTRANIIDPFTGLLRINEIPQNSTFSHFAGYPQKEGDKYKVAGCYSSPDGLGCDVEFVVPEDKVQEVSQKFDDWKLKQIENTEK